MGQSGGGGGGGGRQLLFPGGSTVWTEQTLAEDTPERECPHDVVGLRPHDGTMWMSNDRVPLKKFESLYGGGVSLHGASGDVSSYACPAHDHVDPAGQHAVIEPLALLVCDNAEPAGQHAVIRNTIVKGGAPLAQKL